MTPTPIDAAHAGMEAAPGDDAARLRFFERLADSELFLLIRDENAGDDSVTPEVFALSDARFVLAFDREDRLSAFTGKPAPYAALSGRALARMMAEEGLGLGLNLDVAPSSFLLPPDGVAWLARTLASAPEEVEARPQEIHPPGGLPDRLIDALATKLATAAGLAETAYLAGVRYDDGRPGHLLAFVDAVPGAEPALAQAASEALIFSGLDAGEMDVSFLAAHDPVSAQLARVGLRFDLPRPDPAQSLQPGAPGMDPDKPPRLK